MLKFIINTLVFLCLNVSLFAQQKYWITFKDKDTYAYCPEHSISPEAINNRLMLNIPLVQYTDIPLHSQYLSIISASGIKVEHRSKWLNSVSAYLNPEQLKRLSELSFVSSIEPINSYFYIAQSKEEVNPANVHTALSQMHSYAFTSQNITGKGVKIGVVDAGFYRAHLEKNLEHLYREFRIVSQRDFQNPERKDIITQQATSGDGHGKSVLEKICGYDSDLHVQYGMAVNAQFYLARTENGDKENRGEEDKWIEAVEWLDSLGVRLISTSLGYATKMDDPNDNYKQEEMDGKTSKIAQAAQLAVDSKGIFLVVSAGNEGSSPWKIISSPADCRGALSVGATREFTLDKIGYSSIGPEHINYLKPEVACFSPNGTSFSAPSVTGFVACLMEKAPNLSNKELKSIIEKSAHLYPFGNNYIGYGVPLADRALKLLDNTSLSFNNTIVKEVSRKKAKIKLPPDAPNSGILFHKKNASIVIKQQEVNLICKKFKLRRPNNTAFSTLSVGNWVIEFVWK